MNAFRRIHPALGLLIVVLLSLAISADSWAVPCPDCPPLPQPLVCPAQNALAGEILIRDDDQLARVGKIPDAFSVSSTGQAAYRIALRVPPGRAGMEPHLGLSYNSGAGEGPFGMGFALEGLSAIARCPSNVAQDGRIRGVKNDKEDNFCLDGLRLVHVGNGVGRSGYGPAYDEYRTFPDTFRRVRAYPAGSDSGPQLFVVETKAGRILKYGDEDPGKIDGRVMGKSGVVRAWWVTRELDRHDNAILYSYRNEPAPDGHTVTHVPKQIDYTDHPSAPSSRQVVFDWTDWNHHAMAFTGGMEVSRRPHIQSIRMLANNATVLGYQFEWGNGSSTRGRIFQIAECAENDPAKCRPPTQLGWQDQPGAGFSVIDTGISYPSPDQDASFAWVMADVTGDGLGDLVITQRHFGVDGLTDWSVAQNLGGQLGAAQVWTTDAATQVFAGTKTSPSSNEWFDAHNLMPMDFDHDGIADLLFNDPWGGPIYLKKAQAPNGFKDQGTTGIELAEPTQENRFAASAVLFADLDGDGMMDVIECDNAAPLVLGGPPTGNWRVRLWGADASGKSGANAKGSYAYNDVIPPPFDDLRGCYLANYIHVVDLDQDGKAELLVPPWGYPREEATDADGHLNPPQCGACVYDALQRNQLPGGGVPSWSSHKTNLQAPDWSAGSARVLFADVNGDGLPDAITANALGGVITHRLWTYLNTGDGFDPIGLPSLASPFWAGKSQDDYLDFAATLDYDGDGQTDILVPMRDAGCPYAQDRCWVILQASPFGDGHLDVQQTNIAFSSEIDKANKLGFTYKKLKQTLIPRVTDLNGDGRQDVVIPSYGTYKMLLSEGRQDLLVSVTDGMNPLDPGDGFQVPPDDGFMPNVTIQYGTLIDHATTAGIDPASPQAESELYLPRTADGSNCDYPRTCVVGPQTVVASYKLNNGQNQERGFDLRYRDGRGHQLGRGFLGFRQVLTIDEQTHAGRAELYDNGTEDQTILNKTDPAHPFSIDVFPHANQLVASWSWTPDLPSVLSTVTRMHFVDLERVVVPTNGNQTYFTLPLKTHTRDVEDVEPPPGSPTTELSFVTFHAKSTLVQANLRDSTDAIDPGAGYDAYGNVLLQTSDTKDVEDSRSVERIAPLDVVNWLVGEITKETSCSKAASAQPAKQCRITDRVYDNRGDVSSETVSDPASSTPEATTTYTRDAFGNVIHLMAQDHVYGHQRAACVGYDAEGLFPYVAGNAAGHFTYAVYDSGLGVLFAEMDPNGLITRWQHDSFGRATQELRPDNTKTTFRLTRAKDGGPGWWTLHSEAKAPGWGDNGVDLDSLGRTVRSWTRGPTDPGVATCGDSGFCSALSTIEETVQYDLLGRVASRSKPYPHGDPSGALFFTTYQYDNLGRVLSVTTPWKTKTSYVYSNNDMTATTPATGMTPATSSSTMNDAWGRPVTVIDGLLNAIKYTYGPFGGLRTVTPPDFKATITERDAFGRVVTEFDPDRGKTIIAYDGFGERMLTEDQQHLPVSYDYDAIGRLVLKTDEDGQTLWQYDDPQKGLGRLSFVESPAGIKRSYTYTSHGKLHTEELTAGSDTLLTTFDYDLQEHLSTIESPAALGQVFRVRREYDDYGHLLRVKDDLSSTVYWELGQVNGVGQTMKEQMSNGSLLTQREYYPDQGTLKRIFTKAGLKDIQDLTYVYDGRLNLTSRTDALQQGPLGALGEYFTYDELDRLRCGNVGKVCAPGANCTCDQSVTYLPNGNIDTKSGVGAYKYDDDPAHPHAVQRVVTGGADEIYKYDHVGNQTDRPGVHVDYTPFDMPARFKLAADGSEINLEYDGAETRVRKTTPVEETLSFDDYERVTHASPASVEHRYYVSSDERVVAVVTRTSQDPAGKTAYLHVDHLGSTDKVTNEAGTILEPRSYDAFGARRNPSWSTQAPSAYVSKTIVGYTGHDDDEDLGLVNMKGRIYDPRLARFLTTDPHVSRPRFSQSWNPYGYVWNNPLAFTDPSGFDPGSIVYTGPDDKKVTETVSLPDDIVTPGEDFTAAQKIVNDDSHGAPSGKTRDSEGPPEGSDAGVESGDGKGQPADEERYEPLEIKSLHDFWTFMIDGPHPQHTLTRLPGGFRQPNPPDYVDPNRYVGVPCIIPIIPGFPELELPPAGQGLPELELPPEAPVAPKATIEPLGRGSTANGVDRWLPRTLREQVAVQEAMQNPAAGRPAAGPLGDPRWPASEGWQKMQQTLEPGGRGGPISVHYNYNPNTGAVDDLKIVLRRTPLPIPDPSVSPGDRPEGY